MIKIKVLDDRCLVIPDFKEGDVPDESEVEEFSLSELTNIVPILKLFDEASLKRIDTITVKDEVMEIIETNDEDPFGANLDW